MALLELAWWVQRKGPMRAGFEPLPATERVILGYLEGHEGSSVTEVGAALDIKPSNVSAAVRDSLRARPGGKGSGSGGQAQVVAFLHG